MTGVQTCALPICFPVTIYPRDVALWGLFRHDNKSVYNVFYGLRRDIILSVIVNGQTSQGNATDLNKQFLSCEIISDKEPFDSVEVVTTNQISELNPFYNQEKFWETAVYENDLWKFPMPVQKGIDLTYGQESVLTGRWLKIKLVYKGVKDKFIQSIKTKFNPL